MLMVSVTLFFIWIIIWEYFVENIVLVLKHIGNFIENRQYRCGSVSVLYIFLLSFLSSLYFC